ncbi:nicotinate phosphoribosyltransferase [Lachnospiraceae bacterium OttesenSCG-928-E19]|nr:nicotinate phosphoribosyltransferase [Lachnospiraceae bacterium OttesenSCG-928-E19]
MTKQKNFWCDFYHLTTAQTFWREDMHNQTDTFEMYIRKNPFKGGYTMAAGLAPVLEWLNKPRYSESQIKKLAKMKYKSGRPMFDPAFLEFIRNEPFQVSVKAVREGDLVFPNEPIVQVSGPKWQVLMVETAILNAINASSLIATKTSRIVRAANGRPVSEYGLRRMQELYGLNISRSAFVGGVSATSNVDAGLEYKMDLSGTHPHAYVMSFENEYRAFHTWLKHNPENPTLLIDTNNTINGAKIAIRAARDLGIDAINVRLDSGDMAHLSREVRKLFDAAGMPNSKIVASNDLDEYSIESLIAQGAKIDIFGVGTNMVTAADQPALGGVYKIKRMGSVDKIKFSEDPIKTTIPGATETIRMLDSNGNFDGDVILSTANAFTASGTLQREVISIDPQTGRAKTFPIGTQYYKPSGYVVKNGVVDKTEMKRSVKSIAKFGRENLNRLDESHKRLLNAHRYIAGIEDGLYRYQQKLINQNQKGA